MTEKRTENWIYIQTPDNRQLITHPDNIKKLLGIEEITSEMVLDLFTVTNFVAGGMNE